MAITTYFSSEEGVECPNCKQDFFACKELKDGQEEEISCWRCGFVIELRKHVNT